MRRPLAALLVAAVALGLLTACAPPVGGDAEKWLLTSDIVDSVETDGHYNGFTFIPSVTATVDDDATDAEVRELTLLSSEYLNGPDRWNLSIGLVLDMFSIDVPRSEAEAGAAAALWATARADDRVSSGRFSGSEATIAAPKPDIVTVFPQYAPGLDALTVHSDDDNEYDAAYQLTGTSACFAAAESDITALLTDDAIVAVYLDACDSGSVATEADAVLPTAERLAAELADAPFALTVVRWSASSNENTRSGREIAIAALTPDVLGLLQTVEGRDPLAMRLDEDGALEVAVEAGDLKSAATSILLDPGFASVRLIVMQSEGVTVHLVSIAETPAVLDLAEGFVDLELANSFFYAPPGEVTLSLGASVYTEENARQVVDLVLANPVWRDSTIYIGDTRDNGATFTDGDPVTAEGELAEAITAYWLRSI